MNNLEKIELMKLAVQLVIADKSAGVHLVPAAKQRDCATDLAAMVYKSLLATLTDSA